MKLKHKRLAVVAAVLAAVPLRIGWAQQEQPAAPVSLEIDLAYVSKYVWRGLLVNPDPAFQPSLTMSNPSGLSLNWWGSLDTTDVAGNEGDITEIDYTLDYSWEHGGRTFNAGLIHYTFPHTQFASTTEGYATVCLGGRFSPSLSVNYDFDEADGFYVSLAAGYACPIARKKGLLTSLNLSARLSYGCADYNAFYFGAAVSALTDMLVTASVPIALSDRLTVTPALSYSTLIDGDLRRAVADPDTVVAGVTVSTAF